MSRRRYFQRNRLFGKNYKLEVIHMNKSIFKKAAALIAAAGIMISSAVSASAASTY